MGVESNEKFNEISVSFSQNLNTCSREFDSKDKRKVKNIGK